MITYYVTYFHVTSLVVKCDNAIALSKLDYDWIIYLKPVITSITA